MRLFVLFCVFILGSKLYAEKKLPSDNFYQGFYFGAYAAGNYGFGSNTYNITGDYDVFIGGNGYFAIGATRFFKLNPMFTFQTGLEVEATPEKPFSSDANIAHRSYEAGALEDPMIIPDDKMFHMTKSPQEALDKQVEISIDFIDGLPVRVSNKEAGVFYEKSLEILNYLNLCMSN